MKKARHDDPEIAHEYDFSKAVRSKYYQRMKGGFTVRIVSDEKDRRRQARLERKHISRDATSDEKDLLG